MGIKNILVFPCGSEIGLDIHTSVKYSTHFHLIGASSINDHGKFVYDDYIGGLPYVSSPDFIPKIQQIVKERDIDAIYPTMDLVISVLKDNEHLLGCKVIAPSPETSDICLSKSKTYELLRQYISVPEIYSAKTVKAFPCFAKPDVGYGARGTKILYNQEEVDKFSETKNDFLLVEYLPGDEFTVDCFSDRSGKLLYCNARRRNRIKSGISVNSTFVEYQDEFLILADKINMHVSFRGAWFFQVKRKADGTLCLLEIAARLGGSSLLSNAIGVNLALLTLFDAFGYDVSISPNHYPIELDRALNDRYKIGIDYDAVYVDYDDCLILKGRYVNTEMVQFLYKCLNERIPIFLLTKHNGDLLKELAYFKLDSIFTEVFHIPHTANKTDFIKSDKAIFIDDSYAERLAVQKRCGIPVFGPDMIRILL